MTLKFQITDFIADDIYLDGIKKFCITIYGKDQTNENVACHILDYLPFFYFKIPESWDAPDSFKFLKRVCQNLPEDEDSGIPVPLNSLIRGTANNKCKTVYGKDFYNFEWDKDKNKFKNSKFYKACFNNLGNMKKIITELKKFYNNDPKSKFKYLSKDLEWINLDRVTSEDRICDSNLYESFLHPIIRFIHERDIDPTGWVKCNVNDKCKINIFDPLGPIKEYACQWNNINKIEDIQTSNYKIASFDIECDSLHGDFPMAKKSFKKTVASIFDSYKIINSKCDGVKVTKPELSGDDSDDDIEDIDIYLEDINYDLISIIFGKLIKIVSLNDV